MRLLRRGGYGLALVVITFAQEGRKVAGSEGFELRLTAEDATDLRATLYNRSNAARSVLKSSNLQPPSLELVNSAGKRLKPFDERTRRKYDRSVSQGMYTRLKPGAGEVLESGQFQKEEEGAYSLRWGPYTFREVPPGTYTARAAFESAIDWVTRDGREAPARDAVWKGKLTSNPIEIRLPR